MSATGRDAHRDPEAGSGPGPGEAGQERYHDLPVEAESFLTHLAVERGRSPRTITAYRRDLSLLCGFLAGRGTEMVSATPDDLHAYGAELREMGLAAASRTRMLVSVRGCYRFLMTEGILEADPASHLETPRRPDSLPKSLDVASVEAILDTLVTAAQTGDPAVSRDRALLEFLYGTGARVSEACGLGFGDLDLDASLVRLRGKRDKERIVPMGVPAKHAIEQYLDRGRPAIVEAVSSRRGPGGAHRDRADAVFLGVRGGRLSRQAAWQSIRCWARRAGVSGDISPHVLRHSCATHLLEGGADIRIVAELLGHVSVSTTQIYTRVANDLLFDAYERAHPRANRSLVAAGP